MRKGRKHLFPYNHRRCHKQPFQIPKMKAQQLPTFLRTSIDLRIPIRLLMGGTPAKKEIIHNLFSTTSSGRSFILLAYTFILYLYARRDRPLQEDCGSQSIDCCAAITLKIEVLLSLKEILGARLTEKKKKTLLGWDNYVIGTERRIIVLRIVLGMLLFLFSVVLSKIVEQSPFSLSG
ncbi:hypothetical protein ACJX0J_000182 (mitochondrion) [Zea mays]